MKPRLLAMSHSGVLGVNRALYREIARLDRCELTLVVAREWEGDLVRALRYEPSGDDAGVRVVALPVALSGNGSLFVYRSGLSALARERPDHVWVDEEPWSFAALQAFHAFRRSPRSFTTKQNLLKQLPPPFEAIRRRVHAQATHAYACSAEVEQVLRAKGFRGEVRYWPCTHDPALFHPLSAAERAEVRRELGVREAGLLVAYFGRLTAEKGIADLAAAAEVAFRDPALDGAQLLWVGNGPLADEAAASAARLAARGAFRPAIPHDQVGRAMAACDVVVVPSRTTRRWKEQFGRVVTEAWAAGAAVIGSDSGEIPQLIARSGGGLVFPEGDVAALARRLVELARDPGLRLRLAAAGRRYSTEHFRHAVVARCLLDQLGF